MSFSDLDQALEDTVLAVNTGCWRTRDGFVIRRVAGKSQVANPVWRGKLDEAVAAIDAARQQLRDGLGLNVDFYQHGGFGRWMFDRYDDLFTHDSALASQLDRLRQRAVDLVNEILTEIGDGPLTPLN
ncbi:MAG: hypothetical protein AB1551_08510 [Actinomycetota bacterium]